MRKVTLDRPFSQGVITDVPAYALGPQNSAFAQDGYSPTGVFMQRKGWQFDGTTADVADDLVGVYRAQFALADVTRTLTCDNDGDFFIHNPSGAGTALSRPLFASGNEVYLPRCVYRDELIFCAQDGAGALLRYSGASAVPTGTGNHTWTDGEATLSGRTFASAPQPGSYKIADGGGSVTPDMTISYRILNASTTSITLEGVRASATSALTGGDPDLFGTAFPAVAVYEAGTITVSSGTATGYGTDWSGGSHTHHAGDAVLILPTDSDAEIGSLGTPTDTSASVNLSDQGTKSSYRITRRCPFKDVAAHKESLVGIGVAQFPNRVYWSPPGWNPSFPPGATLPFDPQEGYTSSNGNDFLLDFIDVPAPYDGDHNVAILPSPNPLLVLKRHAVYGIFGSFGGLSVDLVADGIGCIDIRSAQSYDEGQFWCGETGIFWYTNGQIVDLTAGKINREWRELTRDFDYGTSDYCSLGMASGHLVVHITTGGGTIQRTYLCDLRDQSWQSRVSNFNPRYQFTSRIPGEAEKLLAVTDDQQGRVLDFAPALDGSGTADDDAGDAPRLQARTTTGLGRANGIEGITTLSQLFVHANVYDAGAAGSTNMNVSVVSGGGTTNAADATKTLTDLASDTVDDIRRTKYTVNRHGRTHQVRFDVDAVGTDTAATKVEVHQIIARVQDWSADA